MEEYFRYGETELSHLRRQDERLAEVIDRVGMVKRRVIPDLFAALVHTIVGQQISTRTHETIWQRIQAAIGPVTPAVIDALPPETLRNLGLSLRKVGYIRSAARKIIDGEFDIDALRDLPDEEVCARLSALEGIGVWSAEMLMLHSLQRPDILSYGDLAVRRGLRMLHGHREIDRALSEKYRRRYSPCGSVACIYLWAVFSGAIAELKDHGLKRQPHGNPKKS